MAYCLLPEFANEFLKRLKNGELNPDDLAQMTSKERRAKFGEFLNETDAKEVNALFESKLLLKNKKLGMVTWAKKVSGISEPARKDLISKINRLERVLNPTEEQAFLEDLAAQKLGIDVSIEESKEIFNLAKKAEDLRLGLNENSTQLERRAYGLAVKDFQDYLDEINPPNAEMMQNILNLPKSLQSTLDLSAPLRQGWGMWSRPEFYKAFPAMFKYAASKKGLRELQADIISHPDYDLMKASGLRISSLAKKLSQMEEDYMSKLVKRIPGVSAAERGYVGFLNKLRADVFVDLINKARFAGEDVSKNSKVIKDIANVVNDFTGSGNVGTGDKYANIVPVLNGIFFSPRKISAALNMMNPIRYINPKMSKTARTAALRNLLGSLGMSATIIGLGSLAFGTNPETDPTSSDFGKLKISKKTRADVTGGNMGYAVLLSRLIRNQTKSSTTGKIKELGEGYKPETRASLILKFARNKLGPISSAVADFFLSEENGFDGPFDVKQQALDLFKPMVYNSVKDIIENDKDKAAAAILLEFFGAGTQSY